MTLKLDDFKSVLKGGGARSNLFSVELKFPTRVGFIDSKNKSNFLCTATNLPGSTITDIPVTFRGRVMHVAGDKTFEPWSVTILNDTDFEIRNAFERWMNLIAHQSSSQSSILDPRLYKEDMTVKQLDRNGQSISGGTYKFKGVYPSSVSNIELSNESGDIETFSVELQVDYWVNSKSTPDSQSLPELFNRFI